MLYYIISYYIMLHYIILYYIILHYIILYYIISYYIVSYYITLYYIISYYIIQRRTLFDTIAIINVPSSIYVLLSLHSYKFVRGTFIRRCTRSSKIATSYIHSMQARTVLYCTVLYCTVL